MIFHRINIILLFLGITLAAGNDVIDLKNEISTATTRHHHSNIRGGGASTSGNALDDLDILLKEEDHDQQVEREAQQDNCGSWKDCPSGYRCKDRTCRHRCSTNQDCSGFDFCAAGICESDIIPTCRTDRDCQRGEKCDWSICIRDNFARCRSSSDCGLGQRCDTKTKYCVTDAGGGSCMSIRNCPNGFHCQRNICIPF